jgi:hypothetical protein
MYIFVLISPLSYSVLTSLCNTISIVVEALFITVIGLNLTYVLQVQLGRMKRLLHHFPCILNLRALHLAIWLRL